jgi:hypothetical protein
MVLIFIISPSCTGMATHSDENDLLRKRIGEFFANFAFMAVVVKRFCCRYSRHKRQRKVQSQNERQRPVVVVVMDQVHCLSSGLGKPSPYTNTISGWPILSVCHRLNQKGETKGGGCKVRDGE